MAQNDDGSWGKSLAYGFEIAVGTGLGAVIGSWIDRHRGTDPWGLLVGVLLGCAAGMYLLLKDYTRANKD